MTNTPGANRKVLIIEDNLDFAKIYKDLLSDRGFQVIHAENGENGVGLAKEKMPDVILLDLILPKINGFEALQQIRQMPETKDIPVIIFSVMGDQTEMQKAFQLGADDFSIKGFAKPMEIFAKIEKVITQRSSKSASS